MKCPRCGSEMVMDAHRKMELGMCYECGYVEGSNLESEPQQYHESGLEHLYSINLDESVSTIAKEIDAVEKNVNSWAKRLFYRYIR